MATRSGKYSVAESLAAARSLPYSELESLMGSDLAGQLSRASTPKDLEAVFAKLKERPSVVDKLRGSPSNPVDDPLIEMVSSFEASHGEGGDTPSWKGGVDVSGIAPTLSHAGSIRSHQDEAPQAASRSRLRL